MNEKKEREKKEFRVPRTNHMESVALYLFSPSPLQMFFMRLFDSGVCVCCGSVKPFVFKLLKEFIA